MGARLLIRIGCKSDVKQIVRKASEKQKMAQSFHLKLEAELNAVKELSEAAHQRKGVFFLEKEIQLGECRVQIRASEPFHISLLERINSLY